MCSLFFKKGLISAILLLYVNQADAQFAPPAGQTGTTAMDQDSSAFVNWASACTIVRGYQDISDPGAGFATVGDSTMATGQAGTNGIVSLGDAGIAILQFPFPITNGPGYDFAVFENSFSDDYLELAFVEVSSDGINFFRFPATSNTQDTLQVGPFDLLDATKLNNLAGKYRGGYGTPFDLSDLAGISGLDITHVTHIKIIDVVGSISAAHSTSDQNGKKVNDPWPTQFPSSGFDLDAVGVIHQNSEIGISELVNNCPDFNCFINENILFVSGTSTESTKGIFSLYDVTGKKIGEADVYFSAGSSFDLNFFMIGEKGIYFAEIITDRGKRSKKIVKL